MATIETLKHKWSGEKIYPITSFDAVKQTDGTTLTETIADLQAGTTDVADRMSNIITKKDDATSDTKLAYMSDATEYIVPTYDEYAELVNKFVSLENSNKTVGNGYVWTANESGAGWAIVPVMSVNGQTGDIIVEAKHIILTATLVAGETSLVFTNSAISDTSLLSVYTSDYSTMPTAMTQSGTTVTMTFDAQSADIVVKLEVQ